MKPNPSKEMFSVQDEKIWYVAVQWRSPNVQRICFNLSHDPGLQIFNGFRSQHMDTASKATTNDTIKFMLSKHAYEFRQALISPCPMTQICDAFSEKVLAFCSWRDTSV